MKNCTLRTRLRGVRRRQTENKVKPNNSCFGWKLQSLSCSFLATQERQSPKLFLCVTCPAPLPLQGGKWAACHRYLQQTDPLASLLTGGPKATGALGTTLFSSPTLQRKRLRPSEHAAHLGLPPPASAPPSFPPGFQYRRGWTPRQMGSL